MPGMPELPEVETVRRGLARAMTGRTIVDVAQNRPDLRFPLPENFAGRLEGQTVRGLDRRAKYILVELSGGEVLILHLGMSGRFLIEAGGDRTRPGVFHHESRTNDHRHVILTLSDGTRVIYEDPRRFGIMDLAPAQELAAHRLLAHLGIEPLSEALTPQFLVAAFGRRRTSLKAALLDQTLIAGIGNIYACEALFRARLSPRRTAASLGSAVPGARAVRLAAAIRGVLQDAIAAGGSTLRDYVQADGELGYFQHSFAVYDRAGEPCLRDGCSGRIVRIVQSGRSTFYCPACQH